MASYRVEIDGRPYQPFKATSKDDVIQILMGYINGDGVVQTKVTFPDGSFYEFEGEGEE